MTSEEMIAQFTAKNDITKCPDHHTRSHGNSRVANTRDERTYSANLKRRNLKTFICEVCSAEDTPPVKVNEWSKAGTIAGVYRGNTWCFKCRNLEVTRIEEEFAANRAYRENITRFGSEENYNRATGIKKHVIADLETFNRSQLKKYLVDVEWLLQYQSFPNLTKRVKKANDLLATLVEDNWDDWDTPLGE